MSLKSVETLFFIFCPIHDFIFQFPKFVPLKLFWVNDWIYFLGGFPEWWVVIAPVHCLKALWWSEEVGLFVWSLSWRSWHHLDSVLNLLEFLSESLLCGFRLNYASSIWCIDQEVHQGTVHDLLLLAGCETLKLLITPLSKNRLAFKNLLQASRWYSVLLSKGLKRAWLFALTWVVNFHGLELLDSYFRRHLGFSLLLWALEDLADLLGADLVRPQHWEINVEQFCDALGRDSLVDGPQVLGHLDHLVSLGGRQLLVEDLGVDVTLHQERG